MTVHGKESIPQPFLTRENFLNCLNVAWRYTRKLLCIKIQVNQFFQVIGIGVSFTINLDQPAHD